MKSIRYILSIVLVCVWIFGCQNVEGECWPVGEDGQGEGAGGGVITPGGPGGFGDVPPPEPQDMDDPPPDCDTDEANCKEQGTGADGATFASCSTACKCSSGVHGFDPSVFKFVTIVPDDGEGAAGGYQSASAKLGFLRWTSLSPDYWECNITIGMPIRTQTYNTISPAAAASISAGIATVAGKTLMDVKPDLPGGIFCSRLPTEMTKLFKSAYPGLGASVK